MKINSWINDKAMSNFPNEGFFEAFFFCKNFFFFFFWVRKYESLKILDAKKYIYEKDRTAHST